MGLLVCEAFHRSIHHPGWFLVPHRLDCGATLNPKLMQKFKGQLDDEVIASWFRRHWLAIFPRILMLIFLLGVSVVSVALIFLDKSLLNEPAVQVPVVLGFLLSTYLIHSTFFHIYRHFFKKVFITNHRVVISERSLFFVHQQNSIDLENIQDMHVEQNGFLENLMDYGTLTVILSSANEEIQLRNVPNPHQEFKELQDAKKNFWGSHRRNSPQEDYQPTVQ